MNTRNVLGQRRYAVNVIIADVGYLSEKEIADIATQIPGGRSDFDGTTYQLHLYWDILADTMGDGMDTARAMLGHAQEASNVYVPRTIAFDIREIDSRTA